MNVFVLGKRRFIRRPIYLKVHHLDKVARVGPIPRSTKSEQQSQSFLVLIIKAILFLPSTRLPYLLKVLKQRLEVFGKDT